MSKSDKPNLWKDHVDRKAIRRVADEFTRVYPSFERDRFVRTVCDKSFLSLELKERINRTAAVLREFLPDNYPEALTLVVNTAPILKGFANWILTSFVEQFGLDRPDVSIPALYELTQHGTAEFAIRPFLIRDPERLMPVLHEWALDPNEHVRRLAAEGSRPRGVWVAHIETFKKNPEPVIELLGKLKADQSKYVQKAVANNLNDISRDHPDAVIKIAKRWLKNGDGNTAWIVRHACRTLIKQGHPGVFPVFGFTPNPKVDSNKLKLSPGRLKIGNKLTIAFDLHSSARKDQRLAIDYRVYFNTASGKLSPKVFKLAEKTIKAGEMVRIEKRHSFAPATTRKLYPGKHIIEIIINGEAKSRQEFELIA